MSHIMIRLHPIMSFLLALTLAAGSLAASARPTPAANILASADGPEFPDCSVKPTCTNLRVFLLIDDSSSMFYSDRKQQRLAGAKNVLDILAREYYLPAVEDKANNPGITLPNIQVSLIHFSWQMPGSEEPVLYNSGWKTIHPNSIAEWADQLQGFDSDLNVKVDYSKPQATDFRTAFSAAARLAAEKSPASGCPPIPLVMLFTDGMPNLGQGNLYHQDLTDYMDGLRSMVQSTFKDNKGTLFVTTFGTDGAFIEFWKRVYQKEWETVANNPGQFDPERVKYVPVQELAARMERIIGSTIGTPVYTLTPIPDDPKQYTTEIPRLVASLRLTYYAVNTARSFTVTGPGGKRIQPDGKNAIFTGANTSIQVLEILKPTPGTYKITADVTGGLFSRLLRFEKITAKFAPPMDPWLRFTSRQFGIQLLGEDGKPLSVSPLVSIQAKLTQADKSTDLALAPGSDTYKTNWMPTTPDKLAAVYACATMKDDIGKTVVLYNDRVGEINIDPVTVQVGQAENACVPNDQEVSMKLQLINGNSKQPAAIDLPVKWTSLVTFPKGAQLNSAISEIDPRLGTYVLHFKPTSDGNVKLEVTAGVKVGGAEYRIYDRQIPISIQTRHLALTLDNPETPADRLSKLLYRGFHPGCIDDKTAIVIGRRIFGWFGPTQVQINGTFTDTTHNTSEPGIERFAVQLVSPDGGPSSEKLSSWTVPQTGDDLSTLAFRSPGLGLYTVRVTDQGQDPVCAAWDKKAPTQTVLLINDYWEYLVILILIILLLLLVFYLLRRFRSRRYGQEVPLILSSVVLIILNLVLVNLIVAQTFKCQLNCGFLIDKSLNMGELSFCNGVSTPPVGPLIDFTVPFFNYPVKLGPYSFTLVPAMAGIINPPLQAIQPYIAWAIVFLIGLGSLFLASIVVRLVDSQERQKILISFSIWLIIFVIFCGLFYWRFVQ